LRTIYDNPGPIPSFFDNKAQIARYTAQVKQVETLGQALPFLFQLAFHRLNAGQNKEAIGMLDHLEADLVRFEAMNLEYMTSIRPLGAIGWLRMAEQENCVSNHTALSCLAPIEPGGVHQFQTGSRRAIPELEDLLARSTNDLRARWLLN